MSEEGADGAERMRRRTYNVAVARAPAPERGDAQSSSASASAWLAVDVAALDRSASASCHAVMERHRYEPLGVMPLERRAKAPEVEPEPPTAEEL